MHGCCSFRLLFPTPLILNSNFGLIEPHLSQLMEDLEAISKEKEFLNTEKEKAEKKYALAAAVADKQKVYDAYV